MMSQKSLPEMSVRPVEISTIARVPPLQGLSRLLQYRAKGEARLMAAVGAFECGAAADCPEALRLAARTGRLATPAGLDPIGAAVLLGRKPCLELLCRLRKITPRAVVVVTSHGSPPG